jgi:hypothetical protein
MVDVAVALTLAVDAAATAKAVVAVVLPSMRTAAIPRVEVALAFPAAAAAVVVVVAGWCSRRGCC